MSDKIEFVSKSSPDNLARIKFELSTVYPGLFDGDGRLVKEEFDKLAENFEIADERERYEFNWTGKSKSKRLAYSPTSATLIPNVSRSQDFETTGNLIIEGDNLEVLKLMQSAYAKQIKCIYIDPPYNTGNDFVYRDNFAATKEAYWQQSGYKSSDGVRLDTNAESNGRYHSDWLSMMQSRLLLARTLLREDGAVFISIDDHEVHNLRKLMDEVFGSENFVSEVVWEKIYTTKNDSKDLSDAHEYIIVYAKDKSRFTPNLLPRTKEMNERYANPDNDPRGDWKPIPLYAKGERANGRYPVKSPSTGKIFELPPDKHWLYSKDETQRLIDDNRISFGKTGNSQPNIKRFLTEVQQGLVARTLWKHDEVGSNDSGKKDMKKLFGDNVPFDFPKPVSLIKRIIQLSTGRDDVVLDFFAGSGTTAQAVMELNADDSGSRKFILVQMPEAINSAAHDYKTISQISIERVRRAATNVDNVEDKGFRVYELGKSNFPENNFVPDQEKSPAENAKLFEIYIQADNQTSLIGADQANLITEIAVKDGFTLNFSSRKLDEFTHNNVLRLEDEARHALVCLDDAIDPITIEQLRQYADERFICLEIALDTSKKWTLKQIFGINVRVI